MKHEFSSLLKSIIIFLFVPEHPSGSPYIVRLFESVVLLMLWEHLDPLSFIQTAVPLKGTNGLFFSEINVQTVLNPPTNSLFTHFSFPRCSFQVEMKFPRRPVSPLCCRFRFQPTKQNTTSLNSCFLWQSKGCPDEEKHPKIHLVSYIKSFPIYMGHYR